MTWNNKPLPLLYATDSYRTNARGQYIIPIEFDNRFTYTYLLEKFTEQEEITKILKFELSNNRLYKPRFRNPVCCLKLLV